MRNQMAISMVGLVLVLSILLIVFFPTQYSYVLPLAQLTIMAIIGIEVLAYVNYKRDRQERLDEEYEKRNSKNLDASARKGVNKAVSKFKKTPINLPTDSPVLPPKAFIKDLTGNDKGV